MKLQTLTDLKTRLSKEEIEKQGFKTKKDFIENVKSKREERTALKNFLERQEENSPIERQIFRDKEAGLSKILFNFSPSVSCSKHANYKHTSKLVYDQEKYAKYSYKPLEFCHVSYYRIGRKVVSKTFYRGKEQKKVSLLPENWENAITNHPGLLSSEIGIVKHEKLIERYLGCKKTGIAVLLDIAGKEYWEHGKNLKECLKERENKIEAMKIQAENAKISRKAGLVRKLVKKAYITKQDCMDAGNCRAGVENFMSKNGLENYRKITIEELSEYENNSNVKKILDYVSLMIAKITV